MEQVNKTILFNELLSIYGDLLSSTQKDILTSYYDFDLSITEIAELKKVSRSAVEDAIKKGQTKLLELEDKLNILKNRNDINAIISKLKENCKNSEDLEEILKIERIINHGI